MLNFGRVPSGKLTNPHLKKTKSLSFLILDTIKMGKTFHGDYVSFREGIPFWLVTYTVRFQVPSSENCDGSKGRGYCFGAIPALKALRMI